jgi:signal transduction histidine kinase/Tfp pilus assembly protein PilF
MNVKPAISNDREFLSTSRLEEYINAAIQQGKDLAKAGKIDDTIAIFGKILSVLPMDENLIKEYATVIWETRKSFDHEVFDSEAFFEKALEQKNNYFVTVVVYSKFLLRLKNFDKISNFFESALDLEPKNLDILNHYAKAISQHKPCFKKVFELYDRILLIDPKCIDTLNKYANLLFQDKQYSRSANLFEQALKVDRSNIKILTSYAKILEQQPQYDKDRYDRAGELLENALELESDNRVDLLIRHANILFKQEKYWLARQRFEEAYNLPDGNLDVNVLNGYANTLTILNQYKSANNLFERALQREPRNPATLNNYAKALVQQSQNKEARIYFERSLDLNGKNKYTLSDYANFLFHQQDYEEAIDLFQRYHDLGGKDYRTLNNFASALTHLGDFERAILIKPDHSYSRWQYSRQLEAQGKYQDALTQLLEIDLTTQKNHHANIVWLHLGRLYHLLHQPELGNQYIEAAIANSEDKDKTIFHAARSLLVNKPYSKEAIDLLQQIEKSSPLYDEAMKTIALNADAETSFKLFGASQESLGDTEMLYRAMYHKIGNEIAILKSIATRLLRKIEGEHPIVSEIVSDLDELQSTISRQRAKEKAEIAEIPRDNYQKLIEIVSKTAHDISDEVNNILAAIESKTRRALRKLTEDSTLRENFEKLLTQLELTQTALNDLKSINEGMAIHRHRFPVRKLLEKWEPANWGNTPRIQKARITLKIENPNAEFDGDEEKIKSIINELVENSLKHNAEHRDLSIWIYTKDLVNPHDIGMPSMPGDRKYLYIQLSDNGKGVPNDKKEWIFQPLNTTSPEDKGSGLGLFIARKTIQKMNGNIREVGKSGKGARFQIYIPYLSSNEF